MAKPKTQRASEHSSECDPRPGQGDPLSPLAYMLAVVRDESADAKRRDDMAKAAAPFMHPKLSTVEHSGEVRLSHEQALEELS